LGFQSLLAVDLPLLTPEFLRVFHSRFVTSRKPLFACRIDGKFLFGWAFGAADGESQRELLEEAELRAMGFDLAMFANINIPLDWERLAKRS